MASSAKLKELDASVIIQCSTGMPDQARQLVYISCILSSVLGCSLGQDIDAYLSCTSVDFNFPEDALSGCLQDSNKLVAGVTMSQ